MHVIKRNKHPPLHIGTLSKSGTNLSHHIIHTYDELIENETDEIRKTELRHEANQKAADMLKKELQKHYILS